MREREREGVFIPGILNPALLVTAKTNKEILEKADCQKGRNKLEGLRFIFMGQEVF